MVLLCNKQKDSVFRAFLSFSLFLCLSVCLSVSLRQINISNFRCTYIKSNRIVYKLYMIRMSFKSRQEKNLGATVVGLG